MKPEPWTTTFGARRRSRPGKALLIRKNLIEGNAHSKYHGITLFMGLSGPVHASGGRSAKATARFIPQVSPRPDPASTYNENPPSQSGLF